ncbi:transcriptional regulator GcvA [Rugamonas sp. CCM 8940]|uniref:transcriptional regulator GcvA n=1 Tax=Rugamonas sp. CCM 8940 TaxID=2765359 RepID=UPI0018F53ABC|nr:transcriptional regulator GcvA [Rugamonas sp. CCM 8940]MBJ7313348.1 transcriptional regulator GcvA [Rugamonas sp. CCM 8940]
MSATPRLPNFSALRAFEAAARHQNFSRAAEELHLTHGAISHQVRALEEELGLPLFVRNGRHVKVTADGLRFAQVLGRSFAEIAAAAEALRPGSAGARRLTVSSIPSFAARWLAPRLGRFIERHPEVEVVLQSSGQLQDLARDGVDVGIRFGRGHYPGMLVERLMGDIYFPVVSPHYRGGALPATPAELEQASLLRSVEPWAPWLQAAGLALAEPSGGVMFEDLSMLIRSAVDGDGVALVRRVVAMQELASGQLLRLFELAVPCAEQYYFVSPPTAAHKPQVQAFRAWLLAEVADFQRQLGAGLT